MIQTFACYHTKELWELGESRKFKNIENVGIRKLQMIHRASNLMDLKIPPANRLESLKGNRMGQYSIRINDQFRVCFRWTKEGVEDVEIVDYH